MMASSHWQEWRVTEAVASPPYPSPPHTLLSMRKNVRLVVESLVLSGQLFLCERKEKVEKVEEVREEEVEEVREEKVEEEEGEGRDQSGLKAGMNARVVIRWLNVVSKKLGLVY